MQQRIFRKRIVFVIVFLLLVSFGIPSAHVYAKSITWSSPNFTNVLEAVLYDDLFCYANCDQEPDHQQIHPKYVLPGSIGSPSASVTHVATVVDTTTSTNIDDGGTVAVGDTITITPQANQSTDISWFATGYGTDSPYGTWGGGGTEPTGVENINGWLGWDDIAGPAHFENYANLAVTPTTPTISTGGTATLSCTGGTCVVKSAGTVTATVTYPATTGEFYYSYYKTGKAAGAGQDWSGHAGENILPLPMADGNKLTAAKCYFTPNDGNLDSCLADPNNVFVVSVPAIPITVSFNAAIATPPTAPTITGPTAGDTCSASNYTYTFTGTDPNGKTIRYGVDWNDDGAVDEWVPATGYVNSGTAQSTTHSWNTAGTYTFQAETQNSDGSVSGWTTYSITISPCALANLQPSPISPLIAIANVATTFTSQITNNGTADVTQSFTSDLYTCLEVNGASCNGDFPLTLSFWQRLIAFIMPKAFASGTLDTALSAIASLAVSQSAPSSATITFSTSGNYQTQVCADHNQIIPVQTPTDLCKPGPLLVVCPAGNNIVNGACVAPISCSVSAAPTTINTGGTSQISWTSSGATSCTGVGFSTGAGNPPNSSAPVTVGPLNAPPNTYSYGLHCDGPNGASCDATPQTIMVNGPTATITANPTRVEVGSTTALTWSSTNAPSCTMTRTNAAGTKVNWTKPGTGGATSGTNVTDLTAGGITTQTTYTLTCSGAVASTTVNIAPGYTNF